MSEDPTFKLECYRCDLDRHVCHGCGEPLRHDGKQYDGTKHPACTDNPYRSHG